MIALRWGKGWDATEPWRLSRAAIAAAVTRSIAAGDSQRPEPAPAHPRHRGRAALLLLLGLARPTPPSRPATPSGGRARAPRLRDHSSGSAGAAHPGTATTCPTKGKGGGARREPDTASADPGI